MIRRSVTLLACLALGACATGSDGQMPSGPYIAVLGADGSQALSADAFETIEAQVVVGNIENLQAVGFSLRHDPAVEILEWSVNETLFKRENGQVLTGPTAKEKTKLDVALATSKAVSVDGPEAVVTMKLRARDDASHRIAVDVRGAHRGVVGATGERVTLTSVSAQLN